MSSYYLYIIFSLMAILLINSWMVYRIKHSLPKMSSMMYSMYIGMNVGITAGLIFGAVYRGNLFYSTLLSLFIALIVGLLVGIQLGLLSTVESLMAAVMGGMMGAMLGEMISTAESTVLIKIFFTLSASSVLLLFALKGTSEDNNVYNWKWLMKPLSVGAVLIAILLGGHFFEQKKQTDLGLTSEEQQHHSISFTVTTSGFLYTPSTIKLEKGKPVTLTLKNNDQLEHDLEIKSIPIDSSSSKHQHNHGQQADVHLHAKPNSSSQIKFTPLQKGKFEFYCTIPGHKENGMIGSLIVQ